MKGSLLRYSGKMPSRTIEASVQRASLRPIQSTGGLFASTSSNWLIQGDNLIALHAIRQIPELYRQIQLIYIDPPYGTGQTFTLTRERRSTISRTDQGHLAYEDTLSGREYLEFLRERLVLLHDLLSDRGTLYVHLDHRVAPYLRVVLDEIFEGGIFLNEITRIKSNPKNFSRRAYGNIKDTILVYAKSPAYIWNEPYLPYTPAEIERLFPKVDASGRRYTTTPLHAPGETRDGPTGMPWRGLYPPSGRHWRYPPEELERLDKQGLIEWSSSGNPRKKIYLDDRIRFGKRAQDVWEFKDPPYPKYPTQKNLDLLKLIVQTSSEPDGYVLDAFCGSGTTLVAAEQLGRRWIGIDASPAAIQITTERLAQEAPASPYTLYEIAQTP